MDGVSRYLAENYNVFVINMLRSWVLAIIVISISLRKKNGLIKVATTSQPLLQLTRGLLLISAICIGVYSFTKLGLVQTHSILSCYPLIVVAFHSYFKRKNRSSKMACCFVWLYRSVDYIRSYYLCYNF